MGSYWPFEANPYDELFQRYGKQYGVDPMLLRLMAQQESAFKPGAVSPKGARGLFQVMPETAKGMGFDPNMLHDPDVSTHAGARYLSEQLKAHNGDVRLALASYNAGPGAVKRYGGIPPYQETRGYVGKIGDEYDRLLAARPAERKTLAEALDSLRIRGGSELSETASGPDLAERLRSLRRVGLRGDSEQPSLMEALSRVSSQVETGPANGVSVGNAYYNPYPKGSQQWAESVIAQGGKPAIRPTAHLQGAPLPGGTFPESGPFRPFDETYPVQYKGRVVEVIDADTVRIAEVGTNRLRDIRLPDIQAAETKNPDGTPNPIGLAARDYVREMLAPGDQLTVETESGWTGKFDRPIGKIYLSDEQGRSIDLSTPFSTSDTQVVKHSDEMGGASVGTIAGLAASVGQDLVEIAQAPQSIKDLIDLIDGSDDYDPYKESQIYRGLEDFRQRLSEKQAEWVSGGYDPDARVFDIPGLGRLTAEEMFKAGLTATAYTIGIIPVLGHLSKTTRGVALAAKARKGYAAARQSIETADSVAAQVKRVNKMLSKNVDQADEQIKAVEAYKEGMEEALDATGRVMHTMVDLEPNMTAIQRIKLYKDFFLSAWKTKQHPLELVAKHTDHLPEFRHLINQTRAAADVANSPIVDGVIKWGKMPDGTDAPKAISESLQQIWQGTFGLDFHLGMSWQVADRMLDIWNYQNKLINSVLSEIKIPRRSFTPPGQPRRPGIGSLPRRTGGDEASHIESARERAVKLAKIRAENEGRRWIDIDEDTIKEHIHRKQLIEKMYRKLTLYDDMGVEIGNHWDGAIKNTPAGRYGVGGLAERIERTREWSIKASLDVVEDVGVITRKEKLRIIELNEHHAPFHRANLGWMEKYVDKETVEAILYTENEMLMHAQKHASLIGRGLSERSMAGKPIGMLGKGLKPDEIKDLIVDPIQTYVTRTVALNKWANQQRVRNMTGEMIDELLIDKSKGRMHEWANRTIERITDETEDGRKLIEDLVRSGSMSSGWVRYSKNAKGNKIRIGYITHDPAFSQAMKSLDPAHMSFFQNLMRSGWGRAITGPTDLFRKGTVLGLHFMARNPMRDQFMAATLTKYGYTPVVDWWKGLYHVLSRSPLYEQARMGGGTQATHTASTFNSMQDTVTDVQTGETLTQFIRRILGPNQVQRGREHAEAMSTPFFENNKGLRGLLNSARNSWEGAKSGAHAGEGILVGPKMGAYGLRKISETFEEATRIGAYAKAVRRAKKGKKYTFTRSLDEALGGASGMLKMLYSKQHRGGFMGRWNKARHYSKPQMNQMRANDVWLDADMIDEIRNITLDFQQRGWHGETLNAFYPFFNAEMQDVARFTRAMEEAPLTTALRGFTFVTLPAMANWYMNFDNPLYHQLPEVERDLFLHPFGYNPEYKKFQRISRPLGSISGLFGILPHKYLDYWAANDPARIKALEEMLWPGRSARRARNAFIESIHETSDNLENEIPGWARGLAYAAAMGNLPMAATGELGERVDNGNPKYRQVPGGEYGWEQFSDYLSTDTAARYFHPRRKDLKGRLTSAAPQVVAPLVQAGMGYDPFFDRSIGSPSDELNPRLPEDMGNELSSPLERALANGLNTVFRTNMTPQQASHLYRRYTSSIGTMVMNGFNRFGEETGVFKERPGVAKDFTEKFATRAFHSREPYGSNSDSVRQLYDTWGEDKKVLNSLDWAMENGKPRRLMEIMHDHPEFVPAAILQDAMGDMSAFYDLRDEMRVMDGITDEERGDYLLQIDQSMTMYAHEIMRVYWQLKRNPDLVFDLLGER